MKTLIVTVTLICTAALASAREPISSYKTYEGPRGRVRVYKTYRAVKTTTAAVLPGDDTTQPAPQPAVQTLQYSPHPTIQSMLAECNALRAKYGKRPVQLDERLCVAAQQYAEKCAYSGKGGHFVGGTTPQQRIAAAGFSARTSGEIWAGGFADVNAAFDGWMHSRGHRAIILGDYSKAGFGYAPDAAGRPHSYVGDFAD